MNAEEPSQPTAAPPEAAAMESRRRRPGQGARSAPRARALLASWTWRMVLAVALGLPVALLSTVFGVLHSATGTAWLLSGLPGLKVQGPQGALLGATFAADRLTLTLPRRGRLDIEALSWQGARWRWWLSAELWAGIEMERLSAGRVRWEPAADRPPMAPPKDLRLPVQWRISDVTVGSVQWGDTTIQELAGHLHLGADDGRRHEWGRLSARWGQSRLQGQLTVQAVSPRISGQIAWAAQQNTPWQVDLQVEGPVDAFRLDATLRRVEALASGSSSPAPAGKPQTAGPDRAADAPRLDGHVMLRPFDRWPLGEVSLNWQGVDLSWLSTGWPRTALSGHAEVRSAGLEQPATADLVIDNPRAASWDAGGLPLRHATLSMSAVPGRPDAVEFSRATIEWGDPGEGRGELRGQGRWDRTGLDVDLTLRRFQPHRIDRRLPAMTLSGPLVARVTGLPGPGALRPADPASPAPGHTWPGLSADLKSELQGEAPMLREPVQLFLDLSANAGSLQWRRLEVRAGGARAESTGRLDREATGAWRARSAGRLAEFDPTRWMSVEADSAWRQGRHRLNAQWEIDLTQAPGAGPASGWAWVQSLRGTGSVRLAESVWAGVDVSGKLDFGQAGAARAADRSTMDGELLVGRNRLQIRGQADPRGPGDADRWELVVDGRAVRELAPLLALHPQTASWSPRSGQVEGSVTVLGRWPRLVSQGRLQAQTLQAGELSIERGQLRWRADSVNRQDGELRLELHQAQWAHTRLETVDLRLDGTFEKHRAQIDWKAPVPLPAMTLPVLGLTPGRSSQGGLTVEGGWAGAADGSSRWTGTVMQMSATEAPEPGRRPEGAWLDLRNVKGRADFSPGGRLASFQLAEGRARLGPSMRVRWEAIDYRLEDPRRDFSATFEVEPTEIAPMLQRAGTGLQWSGDLKMAAQGRVQAARTLSAQLVLRRLSGDLMVGEGTERQALGLTQAGLSLAVDEGVWRIAPLLSGQALGTISGALELRGDPRSRWPEATDAVSGALQAQVNDLSIWSPWAPPGWGLAGRLAVTAQVAGKLEAPELTGGLDVREMALRNLLQGVSLRDGQIRIALKGERAQIEQFELRAGDGVLKVTGEAELGLQPHARLRFDAQRVTLLGRVDRQLTVSGAGRLDLQQERIDLTGRLVADSGLVDLGAKEAPQLDSDVTLRDEPDKAQRPGQSPDAPARTSSATSGPGPALLTWLRRSKADLDFDLGSRMRIRGQGVDTPLQGQLKVSTLEGRPALLGTVDARGGTYTAYGQKLEIDRGRVLFTGIPDNPRLDILALRPKTDMRVGVSIAGTVQNPRVRLYSEPEMNERDKLSWLVLGRGAEGLGRTDTTVLQRAAVALLSGQQEAPTDTLLRALGIDELTFSQTEGNVRDTVVGLGKQLGRNWYVGYERGVNATAGSWQLIYRLAQRFTLRARSGEDSSLDLLWSWRFDRASELTKPAAAPGTGGADAAAKGEAPTTTRP